MVLSVEGKYALITGGGSGTDRTNKYIFLFSIFIH